MSKLDFRNEQLYAELQNKGSLLIDDVIDLFHVSHSTARRMCLDMVERGKAIRIYKGIQLPPSSFEPLPLYSYNTNSSINVESKKLIGQYAGKLVKSNQIIYASGGTTVQQFVLELANRIRSGELKNISFVTNSTVNADIMSEASRVILVGGEYRAERHDTAGLLAEQLIKSSKFDQCFIGVDGFNLSDGLMALDVDTAHMDQIVSERSNHTFILADSSKFRKNSFITYAPITEKHTIITDKNLTEEYLELVENSNFDFTIL